jgi:hypothetical protein
MSYQHGGAYQQGQAYQQNGAHQQGPGHPQAMPHTRNNDASNGIYYQNTVPGPEAQSPPPSRQQNGLRSHPAQTSPQQQYHYPPQKNNAVQSISAIPSSASFSQATTRLADVEYGQPVASTPAPNGLQYFRQHTVTAPYFAWLDRWEPDVRRRWLKEPSLVKFGTTTNQDRDLRKDYAFDKAFGRERHEGSGHRLKDFLGRVTNRQKDDRYISNYDGRLKELVVMSTDDLFYGKNDATWTRTRMNSLSPFALRVASWCAWSNMRNDLTQSRRVLRRIVGGLLLLMPVIPSTFFTPHGQHNGAYEQFFYSLHGYAKIPRNELESYDRWEIRNGQSMVSRKPRVNRRTMGPAMLCKVTWPEEDEVEAQKDEDYQVNRASVQIIRTEGVSHHLLHYVRRNHKALD